MKKIISFLVSVCLMLSCAAVASASGNGAALYSFYGDGMLFQQNEAAVLAGTAPTGSKISVFLYKDNIVSAEGETVAADGVFAVSFTAPAGGYDEYTVVLECNGSQFAELHNVVFGQLWIASGQSNMQYPLLQEKTGLDMFKNGEKLGNWLRVLLVPAITEYKGSTSLVPCEPQEDIPGACWVSGDETAVYNMSAVAYFFAKDIHSELDMPVGVLNIPLGGSVISSWIGRDAIDSDSRVKDIHVSHNEYYEKSDWVESERSIFFDMTSNYNLKVWALRHFRVSGMIWYQGESDIIYEKTPEQYSALFDLMQRSYTQLFEYKDGLMPVIYTQLASYQYREKNGIDLVKFNEQYAKMQADEPDSRAVVTIYDLPLTYLEEAGAIHPDTKKEIGERMAVSAMSLVYGSDSACTAPYVKSYEVRDGKVYVTLDNTGDGLRFDGGVPQCFAVAGADGVFVSAEAEIISSDTVVIYNEKVAEPVAASYAYCIGNMNANLYATENGGLALPVSPFAVGETGNALYWAEKPWADCENSAVWRLCNKGSTGEYSSWSAVGADIDFSSAHAYSGESGLKVTGNDDTFSISPVLSVRDGLKTVAFDDEGYDYSRYGKIIFRVRNDSDSDIAFDGVKIYTNSVTWYTCTSSVSVIPADGEWHTVEVDIDRLYIYGTDFGIRLSNDSLADISDLEFTFSGENAVLSIDSFEFTAESGEKDTKLEITKFPNIIKVIKMFFVSVFEYLTERIK